MNSPILPDMSFLTYIRQDSVLSVQGSLRLSAEHCGSVLTTRKPEELPNLKQLRRPRAAGENGAECVSVKAGVCTIRLKNNRAAEMIILL